MAIVTVQDIYRCDSCKAASDEFGRGCKHGMLFPLMLIMGNFTECMNYDILVINDNGKDVLDSNETATEIAHKHNAIFGWDYICGDVVMCKDEEVQ